MKYNVLIFTIVIAAVLIAAVSLAATTIFGKSVTMNLAFSIGSNKSTDTLQTATNYSSSHNTLNGTVVALVFTGGREFNGTSDGSYSASANLISLEQSSQGNKFFIVFTNGTASHISDKMSFLGDGKLHSGIFGGMDKGSATNFPLYIIAEYDDIDIANSTDISGTGEIIIKNRGFTSNGQVNMTVERTK